MQRSGFTMIELIFVIVILGILASVAIPRLAATRDDATASTTVKNVQQMVNDIMSYRAAQGSIPGGDNPTDANLATMTNVMSADNFSSDGAGLVTVTDGTNTCLTLDVNSTHMLITYSGNTGACAGITQMLDINATAGSNTKTYQMGGSGINF